MDEPRVMSSLAAWRRKLRALAAMADDAGATPPERANAAALKKQLEERLRQELRQKGTQAGDWTDHAFRLGRWAKQIRKSGSLPPAENDWPSENDWTDHARRLGRLVGRGYRKWFSD